MKITVAMCTYNPSRETIVRALDAIATQLGDVQTEVIVVDNNSSPPLADFKELERYQLRIVVEPRPGLTAAREAVVNNAQGDVIVFVDDDNILGEHYLATVAEAFAADSQLGLLGGCVVPEYETAPQKWFQDFEPWLAVRRYAPELWVETTELSVDGDANTEHFPVGAGFATRRDLAVAYQEDCATTMRIEGRRGSALSSGEDLDLGLFILSQGSKLVVTGSLSLTHVISDARLSGKYLQRLAIGNVKSSLALERKWSVRFGRPIYPMFSMSLPSLLLRAATTTVLGLSSQRYRIKRAVYLTLARARLIPSSLDR
jgi:glycosyltransferase involved in cell wall biosynthesis